MQAVTGRRAARLRALAVVSIGALVAACGGGGSADPTPPPLSSGGGSGSDEYSLFVVRTASGTATDLRAVRWGATPSIVQLDSGGIGHRRGIAEYFVASGSPSAFTDLRRDLAIYNRGDGTLYRVELQSSTTPVPQRVSGETGATTVCRVFQANAGFGGRSQMWYAYELPGTDGNCDSPNDADNVWRLINAETPSTDAPIPMYRPITELIDSAGTQVIGWLVHNSTRLERYDSMMTGLSQVVILDVPGASIQYLETSLSNRIALRVGSGLRVFDPSTNSLSDSYRTLTNLGAYVADETHLYFVDSGYLYRFEYGAASPANPVLMTPDVVDTSSNQGIQLSPTRVVFRGMSGEIKSVLKTAINTAATVLVSPNPASEQLRVFFVDGSQVAFSGNVQATNVRRTGLVADDDENGSSLIPFANTIWVGAPVVAQGSPYAWRLDSLVLSGYDATNLQAGQPVRSYTSAGVLLAELGSVPADIQTLGVRNAYIGNRMLATGTRSGNLETDLFRLSPRTANSLNRMTDTVDANTNEQDSLWQW